MRALLFTLAWMLPSTALAQIAAPPDGLYEDFPSIFMQPSVALVASPTLLQRWVDVRTRARVTTVTFEPDARVVWRITWGTFGPGQKVTLVDGVVWTRSRFTYDAAGRLTTKQVTGHGLESGVTYAYTTDRAGAITARTATLGSGTTAIPERVEVTRTAREVTVSIERSGHRVRSDRYDAERRLLETHFFDDAGHESASLTYLRDTDGALRTIERRIGTHHGIVDVAQPDATLTSSDLAAIASAPIERHEALLLLGAATTVTDEGRGVSRALTLSFSGDACWMNQTSALLFDASGLLESGVTACICGFCVAASLPIDDAERARASGTQEHFTRGPWVRLDAGLPGGDLDVTIEHEVMTPDGPREAGTLRAGDLVLAEDGSSNPLESVELLAGDELRLGVNLTTPDGMFRAGGLLFRSETPRACAP